MRRAAPFLLIAAAAVGCHLVGGTSDYVIAGGVGGATTTVSSSSGTGGSSDASSSSTTSTGVGGEAPECTGPAQCTDAAACQDTECNSGRCEYVTSELGSECLLAPPSTTGVCSASGLCVECLSEMDCPNPGDTCESNNTCKANHCENTTQDVALGETDVDCGGPCPACANGDGCDSADDCQTLFCSTANVCANCENQTSCGSGFYCSQLDSTCKAKLPVGQGCLQDYQCSSNCCFGLFCGFSAQC